MEITKKDIDGLKQLDRIEYRQKREGCKGVDSLAIFSCLMAMGFFIVAIIIDSSAVEDIPSFVTALIGSIIFVGFSFFFVYVKNKELDKLHNEYFKINQNGGKK